MDVSVLTPSANGYASRFTVVDLFCGAGGLSLGLRCAGLVPIHAIDHFAAAIETYTANIGSHAICDEISESSDLPEADMYVGGPPCQGFSSAGLRRSGDTRNSLVSDFAELIVRHRPRAFVFENVEGFLTTENGRRVIDLLRPLIEAGYCIHVRKINAANYGGAQHRKRVVAIGGLGWAPAFPEPTHFAYGAPGASLIAHGLPTSPTLLDCIGDLRAAGTAAENAPLPDHYTKPLTGLDLERALLLRPGQRMLDLPESLQHPSYARRANRRVQDGTPSERRGGAPSGMRRLLPDEPSKAITAAARNEFLHSSENRTLTLRECARLQSFPDTFRFCGSLSDRAVQIGNAVPPLLASRIGQAIVAGLSAQDETNELPGQLLSFVPTLSNGRSPALEATSAMVRSMFGPAVPERQRLLWL